MNRIFKFICCGSVDDGKSTLIGRLLYNSGNIKKDQYEDALRASKKNGSETIKYAMLLDGLLAEREQQITIDIAHRFFNYQNIRFHILDCPGHKQYTANMAIAAAEADAAVVVIDAQKGLKEQTKKHIEICDLFHIKNLCICLTKCDLLDSFDTTKDCPFLEHQIDTIKEFLSHYHFNVSYVPISAATGYNVDQVLQILLSFARVPALKEPPLIMHVQTSKMFKEHRYYYARSLFHNNPKINTIYTLHPTGEKITIDQVIGYGCFQIKEDIDIPVGSCISNKSLLNLNHIYHHTIFFDQQPENILLKHGTKIARVINYTDNYIDLDTNIFFNNIDDIKQNSYAILIDEKTKKTVGCCVFENNNSAPQKPNLLNNEPQRLKQKIRLLEQLLLLHGVSEEEINNFLDNPVPRDHIED